ncbi:methionine adenosyltransferase [Candidatus Heimdallarchaeota archaeon B3_Heim]|nr:MAG: methionine adenosyltransferase [Candidatus Heimdallarchaeota archaeon B3_Heim]
MVSTRHLFSSESVTEGHPDKMADQISDVVLDAVLAKDPDGHVACETFLTTGMAIIGGEISTKTYVDIQKIVRKKIKEIGYTNSRMGFDYNSVAILNAINKQSTDIAQGIERNNPENQGAGDQGMMFGYACRETEQLMPIPITLAHALTQKLTEARKKKEISWLRPDGKSQVTVRYDNGKPVAVSSVVIAAQHSDEVSHKEIKDEIIGKIIKKVISDEYLTKETKFFVNETGRFVIGGPHGDTGLTGRKIIVDTYGGVGSHGGGCFSGKDPSKVDRSGSYAARWTAKNIVAAGLAAECEIQIAYSIGVAKPLSINLDTRGTSNVPEKEILKLIQKHFDFRPGMIIQRLELKRPIYTKTAAYGHFGRDDPDFTWEKTDMASILREEAGI